MNFETCLGRALNQELRIMRDGPRSGDVRDDEGGCGVDGGLYSETDCVRAVKPGRPVFEFAML